MPSFLIRRWRPEDAEPSYRVYFNSVRVDAASQYTEEQRCAWVPSASIEDWWTPRLIDGTAWVAEDAAGLAGLIALRDDGHLDLFFVVSRARGAGAATSLYDALMNEARARNLDQLTSDASHLARRFLERREWESVAEEKVSRSGVPLTRFKMVWHNHNIW